MNSKHTNSSSLGVILFGFDILISISFLVGCNLKGKMDEAHAKLDSIDQQFDSIQKKTDSLGRQMSDTSISGFEFVPFDSTKPHTILGQ